VNAREQQEAAIRLERALAREGIHVERPDVDGGNIQRYYPVPAAALMAPWQARAWRIRLTDPEDVEVIDIGRSR